MMTVVWVVPGVKLGRGAGTGFDVRPPLVAVLSDDNSVGAGTYLLAWTAPLAIAA
jgi:hypothetical protein